MVREGGEEPGEEAEEDGAAGRAGEGDHHAEYQHQVHHHPQVPGWGCRGPAGCGDPQGPSGTFRDLQGPPSSGTAGTALVLCPGPAALRAVLLLSACSLPSSEKPYRTELLSSNERENT